MGGPVDGEHDHRVRSFMIAGTGIGPGQAGGRQSSNLRPLAYKAAFRRYPRPSTGTSTSTGHRDRSLQHHW